LTPALSLGFVPIAHVAVNPQPIPPYALVEFDPVPNLTSATGGEGIQRAQLAGTLSLPIFMPGAATSGPCWLLKASYDLSASVTENITPSSPTSGQAGGLSATYNLSGQLTEVFVTLVPAQQPTWVFNGTISEKGSLNGVISPPDPATGAVRFAGQMEFLELTLSNAFSSGAHWQQQGQTNSQGTLTEIMPASGVSPTVSFSQQDQVTECLMQASPFHPPNPCITIDAVFSTSGSTTENAIPSEPPFFPTVDTGSVQYEDLLTETIMFPDGSNQTLMEDSQNSGTFIIAVLVG
jgi:hypothetical protein